MSLSEIRVNTTKTRTGVGTITYTETGPVITGIATASNFKTGSTNVHSTGVELANINTGGSTATFGGAISGTSATLSGALSGTTASFSGTVSIGGTLTYEDVTNIDSVGIVTARDGIFVPDDKQIKLGNSAASPDFKIYHDSSSGQSLIEESGPSVLKIKASDFRVSNTANSKDYIQANDGAAVKLFYNGGAAKFETTNTGVTVTGNIEVDAGSNGMIDFGDITSAYGRLYADSTGTFVGSKSNHSLIFRTNNTERCRIDTNGKLGINQTPSTAQLVVKNSNDSSLNSIDIFNDNGNLSTSISQDSSGAGSFLQKDNSGTIKTFIKSYGDSYFTGGGVIIGNTAPVFSSPTPSLTIEKSDNATGPLFQMYNAAAGQAGATCEIRAHQNYRDANRIIFGRENNNNWQASAAGTASYMGFWTNSAGTMAERLRIKSDSSILHTRSDNVQRHDVEFRQTGGIGNGNFGGIKWTQGSTGGTFLSGITIAYHDTGRPDMIFYRRDGGGNGSQESMRLDRDGNLSLNGDGGIYLKNSGTNTWQVQVGGNVCTEFASNRRVRMPQVYSTNGSSMRDVQIESDGTLCAGNTSIRASKINIKPQTDVSWLYDLVPSTFNYRKKIVDKENGNHTYLDEAQTETAYGLIAEEVETVNQDFCFYNDGELAGVSYSQLITPLLKAVQDQKKEIETLKTKVAALESS